MWRTLRRRLRIEVVMKKIVIISLCSVLVAVIAAEAQQSAGSLFGLLTGQGLVAAKLERRFGNHLFVPVAINKRPAALMIDTGAPITLIDKNSVGSFALKVENTSVNVAGVFGKKWERYGMSKASSIALANCTLTNVPVALADESDMNFDVGPPETGTSIPRVRRLPHLHGLFGAREMRKFGMLIDCTRQLLYVNPNGASPALSEKVAGFLAEHGFTRVPMRLNSTDHFDVPGTLNGHATRFIVDTGASTTTIDKKTAIQAGIGVAATGFGENAGDGRIEPLGTATINNLRIGEFEVAKATVAIVNVSAAVLHSESESEANAGLLGAEYLAYNFAVIDVGGMALYLRHADKR